FLAHFTDRIVNVSVSEQSLATAVRIPDDKCALVYSGIGDAEYAPLPDQKREAVRLLFIGRYDQQKGLDLLVEAMDELRGEGFALQTIGAPIVGRASVAPLPSHVDDRGWLPRSEI